MSAAVNKRDAASASRNCAAGRRTPPHAAGVRGGRRRKALRHLASEPRDVRARTSAAAILRAGAAPREAANRWHRSKTLRGAATTTTHIGDVVGWRVAHLQPSAINAHKETAASN